MKTNCWLILGVMIATGAIAQDNNSNALPEIPPPVTTPVAEAQPATPAVAPAEATPAPAPEKPKPVKKKHAPVRKINEPTVTLSPGTAEVTVKELNVRGQAGLRGEAIAHLKQGETVNVIDQINLAKHAPNEPSQWAKISYPASASIWVSGKYIDANGVVTPKKLNMRSGPGENYSVVGTLEQGTHVSQITAKNGWDKIEPPANAYGFIAAMYLKQEAPAPAPTPTPVPAPQEIEPTQPPATMPEALPPTVPEPAYNPNIPRVVSHEGVVRHVGSVITPTEYELYSTETDKNIDFLYSNSKDLDLARYVGMRIIVTGEEGLAPRFSETPVLTIQSITVVDTNAVPQRIYYSPRQQQLHRH